MKNNQKLVVSITLCLRILLAEGQAHASLDGKCLNRDRFKGEVQSTGQIHSKEMIGGALTDILGKFYDRGVARAPEDVIIPGWHAWHSLQECQDDLKNEYRRKDIESNVTTDQWDGAMADASSKNLTSCKALPPPNDSRYLNAPNNGPEDSSILQSVTLECIQVYRDKQKKVPVVVLHGILNVAPKANCCEPTQRGPQQ